MEKELNNIIENFFLSIILFLGVYIILYIIMPFNLILHFITAISIFLISLFLIFFNIKSKIKYYIILVTIAALLLTEELFFVSVYVNFGFIFNAILLFSLPIFSYTSMNDLRFRIALEALAIALISRTILAPFPLGLLNFYSYMPAIYGFMIIAILLYLHFRKLKNEDIRLYKGIGKIPEQVVMGLAVGASLGFIEHYILDLRLNVNFDLLSYAGYVLFVMTLVGIVEEVVFRGLLQTSLEKILNKWHAIFITSLIFGMMHIGWMNPLEIIFAYSAGVLFGILAYYYDSLIGPISAHIIGNVVLFLIPFANV
jgi:membrane protease YdiL (CAAX protease family)